MRARLEQAPDAQAIDPADRLYRLGIDGGDRYMQFVAQALGQERARALRQANHGWPTTGFSSGKCPQ